MLAPEAAVWINTLDTEEENTHVSVLFSANPTLWYTLPSTRFPCGISGEHWLTTITYILI